MYRPAQGGQAGRRCAGWWLSALCRVGSVLCGFCGVWVRGVVGVGLGCVGGVGVVKARGKPPGWGFVAGLQRVVLRWCPTLPHPPRCSTIGAVGLSFRVRNGCRAFPPRHDRRKTVQPVVHTPTWHHCVVWGGCGLVVNPHSGCEQSPLFCLPTHPRRGGGVLSSVGPLVPVGSQHLAVLPPLAYQPGSMPGASHPHKGGLETSSRSRLPA